MIAIVFLALAFLVARHFFPATTVNIEHVHTDVLAKTTVFKSDTIVVGTPETSHTLLVATTIRVENERKYPIFLDDFTLTLTDPTGAQMAVKAVQKMDVATTEGIFPDVKPLMVTPLLRDTSIDPGKSVQGTLLFSLPLPRSTWDTRKSAEIQVDIYHGHPVYTTIPK